MFVRTVRSARLALLVLALGAGPALAQEAQDAAETAATAPETDETALVDAEPLPDFGETALGDALTVDPTALAGRAPAPTLKLPALKQPKTFEVNRTNTRPDGSGTVVLKQHLSAEWDAKIGADLGLSGNAPVTYHPLDTAMRDNTGGAAWASVSLTKNASVDARVDPTNDQGRLAGTLKHSMPVGTDLSVTLQNSVSVTDTLAAATPSQVYGNEQTVKFNVLPTGTTLAAGLSSTSDDPVTHNRLSAEQKLLGPLSVSTSIHDVGQTTVSKSISAGFKLKW